jgi:hypothetical protein
MTKQNFLYSDVTDVVICEKCFTKNVTVENVNNYQMIDLKELDDLPRCEVCLIKESKEV